MTDGLEPNTLYHVRVQVAGSTAWSGISSIMTQASPKALSIQSHAAYPNPVVGRHPVALRLEVAGAAQSASSAIYDLSGRKLAEVPLTQSQTGIWTASWPTDDVASGVLQVVTTVTGDGGKQIVRSKIAVVK
jgi:hypothetical protein